MKRGLIAAGIATVALFLAMAPAEERMTDTGGPGMVPFELAAGQDRATEILSEWGEEGQDAARESLWIDFGFLVAYGTFLSLCLAATRDLAKRRGATRLARVGTIAVYLGAATAAFDALENICLLLTLDDPESVFSVLAAIFATAKFALLAAAVVYLLAGLFVLLRGDRPSTAG